MSYSFAELEWLFIHAGGGALYAPTAAAIALAESGGCQYALAGPFDIRPYQQCTYRETLDENSFGLWQINLMAHPQYTLGNEGRNLFRALVNADAAVTISHQGRDFGAWSTYMPDRNGHRAYLDHLPRKPPAPTAPHEDAVLGPMIQPGVNLDPAAENDLFHAADRLGHELAHGLPAALKRAHYYTHLLRNAVR